jgi:hypothetical protein
MGRTAPQLMGDTEENAPTTTTVAEYTSQKRQVGTLNVITSTRCPRRHLYATRRTSNVGGRSSSEETSPVNPHASLCAHTHLCRSHQHQSAPQSSDSLQTRTEHSALSAADLIYDAARLATIGDHTPMIIADHRPLPPISPPIEHNHHHHRRRSLPIDVDTQLLNVSTTKSTFSAAQLTLSVALPATHLSAPSESAPTISECVFYSVRTLCSVLWGFAA